MNFLDTFPGIDECIACYGRVRPATRGEVEAHLRTISAELQAIQAALGGTWYICPRCGPGSAVKWQSIAWE
mgnify:CR=1 FL=1